MRGLEIFSGALASLLILIVGGFLQAAILVPEPAVSLKVMNLASTWQVPFLLISSLVCGPIIGVIAVIAYITIGLLHLPIFTEGGGMTYLLNPGFGYLIGFIPAAWVTGGLARTNHMNKPLPLTICSLFGVFSLHFCGIANLIRGMIFNNWSESFSQLVFIYTIGPLPTQIMLCACVGIVAVLLRRLLLIE